MITFTLFALREILLFDFVDFLAEGELLLVCVGVEHAQYSLWDNNNNKDQKV